MLLIDEYKIAKEALDKSQVISFPTETVMGLGVYFNDVKAYHLLNEIKNRPEDKPYTLMLGDKNDISTYAHLTERDLKIINKFMPGPITLLLKVRDNIPGYVTHNTGVIGVRVPNMPLVTDFIKYCGKPLLVPSANKSGEKPALTSYEVKSIFINELGFIFKEDALGDKPSTIVDLTGEQVKILREGSISKTDIDNVLKENNVMKIAIGSDHGGFTYKNAIKEHLEKNGYQVVDVGTNSLDSCHYPVFGAEVAKKVASKECEYGVVVCTSGEGICMAANKIKGVRCGIAYNDEVAKLMRQHNDANVIAFGEKFMELEDVLKRVDIFLATEFEGGRHQTRVDLIKELEK